MIYKSITKNGIKLRIVILIAFFTISFFSRLSWSQVSSESHIISVNDIQMYYEIHGEGEPLVLLHGFTGSSQVWKPFFDDFLKYYRLIIPDLRGHGKSTNPSEIFTHRQSAFDVFALLEKLGIKKFKAIGSSTGGMTLIHMATNQPARIEAMVLIGATHYFPEQCRALMRNINAQESSERAYMKVLHRRGDEQIRLLIKQFIDFKDSYDDMNFTPPYLSTITASTLIIHGDRDPFFPVSIPSEIYNSIPKSYLWIVPNGGHTMDFGEYAPGFTKVILDFLRGEWEKK